MVLDRVVGPTFKDVGDISPFVGFVAVQEVENPFFFAGPGCLPFYHWVQVVVPSFTTLLPYSAWKMVGYDRPFLWSIDIDQMQQESVFDIHPRPLDQRWIEHLLPSMQTLNISSPFEIFSNSLPVLASIDFDGFSKLLVFSFCPMPLHLCVVACRVLLFLIFGRSSFVQVWVLHLMPD